MTVSPCPASLFIYHKELYLFLANVQQKCIQNNRSKIVSFSLSINAIDPLVVLDKLSQPDKINCYWENPAKKEAIAAIDTVAKFQFQGQQRFAKAEEFVQDCRRNIINFGHKNHFTQPLFFCSFGFFDRNLHADYPFPPATVFLPRWQIHLKHGSSILVANIIINYKASIEKILQVLWSKLEIIHSLSYSVHFDASEPKFSKKSVANPEKFKSSVVSVLKKIHANDLSKIVLADALDVVSNTQFNLFKSLSNLRQLHPNCYVFSISNGKGQNFIGASPERLISIYKKQLVTDALAGSAPRGKTAAEDATYANRLLNSEKERHEHSLVIDFITQRLSELGLFTQVLAPRLRQLSNIQHLWTPINALVPTNVHPLKIVAQMHPTPAVAGAATDVACAEIRRYESFERGLYAAPLGWVDSQGNCEFIVGIRSAMINGDRARLYAGAGIVAGSDPDKELAEIQLKLQALLKALV